MKSWVIAVLALVLAAGAPAGRAAPSPSPHDCEAAPADASPGTAEWFVRDANNLYCGQVRHLDQAQHPASQNAAPATDGPTNDGYREPSRHDDVRFRSEAVTIGGLAAEVYRPCAAGTCTGMPASLRTF